MLYCFDHLKNYTKWNGNISSYTSQSIKSTIDNQIGNSADLNLSLVALLNSCGLEAYPVALSTRSNGFLNQSFPMLSNFNYVIALCIIDGAYYMMDITNDWSGVNLLPSRCLNGKGLIVQSDNVAWVNLQNKNSDRTKNNYNLEIIADGSIQVQQRCLMNDYAAFNIRDQVKSFDNNDLFIENFEDEHIGFKMDSYAIENIDSTHKPIVFNGMMTVKGKTSVVNDLIIFNPLLFDDFETNPLKLEERLYPVEYSHPKNSTTIMSIKIPEGYTVESVPESLSISYNDGECTFAYNVQSMNGYIQVYNKFNRMRNIFPYNEYNDLKSFYQMIIDKHGENIVLKKI